MFNRRFSFANPTVRSATALLVLVGICASALPIPLGRIVRLAKDLSQPFPCQHCACGCKNAEQCWKECCCYTPAQKAEWAKKNGVTPPAYAVLTDEDSPAENRSSDFAECTGSCCSKKTMANRPESKCIAKNPPCSNCDSANKPCESPGCSATGDNLRATVEARDLVEATESETSEPVMVLSIMAYKCSGQATVFSLLPWAIIAKTTNTFFCWELIGWQSSDQSLSPIRVFLFPDVPPPRYVG